MANEMSLMTRMVCLTLATGAACPRPNVPKILPNPREGTLINAEPSKVRFAIVKITRTLVDDHHAFDIGKLPEIDLNTRRVVLDYDKRVPGTEPIVQTYSVKVAVPSERPHSWDINLGDDYHLLIATRGFTEDAKGIKIDGRVKSNYQLELAKGKPPLGPNSIAFVAQKIGEHTAVQVMNDEVPGRIFREFEETEIEKVTNAPPDLLPAGIDDSEEAQQQRWSEWRVIRKRGLL
jgi:hypothetical protein